MSVIHGLSPIPIRTAPGRGELNSPVGFDSKMYPRVLREVARVCEGLVALRAFVRLRLPHVDLRVHLQVRLRTEDLERRGERRDADYSTC